MKLTGMPTGSGLSNVPRRVVCSGVLVCSGRSRLSPSKNPGRGWRGSRTTPTQTSVLAVMGSTEINLLANHLTILTSWTLVMPIPTPSKKHKRPASTTSTPRHKCVAPTLAVPTPHSKRALRVRARRPGMRAPPPEMIGASSLGEKSTETDPCCAPRGPTLSCQGV